MSTFTKALRGLAPVALISAALAVSACASGGAVATDGSRGSGNFGIVRYAGLSSVPGSQPARWSQLEIDQVLELDAACKNQLDPQFPNKVAAIARGAVENSFWGFLGIGGGSQSLPNTEFLDYGGYGGAAGAASGAFAGSMSYDNARKYAQGYCVSLQTGWAQNEGALQGIGIVPWVSYGRMRLPEATDAPTDPTTSAPRPGMIMPPPPR